MSETPDLRRAILDKVTALRAGTSCCPSEVARGLSNDWRGLMPGLRDAAFDLAEVGQIAVTQRGQSVTRDARGPIRLTRPSAPRNEGRSDGQ